MRTEWIYTRLCKSLPSIAACLLAFFALMPGARAVPLTNVDLSGTWTFTPTGGSATTIQVPGGGWYKQGFTTITNADYQTTLVVPNTGQPQIAKVEFGAVNYQAALYINGMPVGTNTTSFTPSCFDITPFVTPGQSYTMRVHVAGRNAFMVNGKSIVPNAAGWSPNTPQGIFRSARLAVYPQVNISDVFVRPSVANRSLSYQVWVTNGSPNPQSLVLSGNLTSWNSNAWAYPTIADQPFSVAAYSVSNVTIGPIAWTLGSNSWWWPNVPYQSNYQAQLHFLNLTLKNGATPLDTQSVRFGFRELLQAGDGSNTCYFLNGIRVNFRGDSLQGADYDSIVYGGGPGDAYDTLPGFLAGTNGWATAVDNYQRLNYNFVRLHQEPVAPSMLDTCDEQGLMVMEETAIRGSNNDQDFILGHDNMVSHLEALYTRDRNHPCIVRESISNEPSGDSTDSTNFETDLYNAAMSVDGTRPLSIDSNGSFYNNMTNGNFSVFGHYGNGLATYTEQVWARPDRPFGQGEFVWYADDTPQGFAWFATGTQAMRRQGASDVRPYTLLSAWAGFVPGVATTNMTLEQGGHPMFGADNLTNAWSNAHIQRVQAGYNPVLVADYDYWNANSISDSAGDWPANVPALNSTLPVTRTLYVYNDTFSGTGVNLFWELRQNSATGALAASGETNLVIPLGYVSSNAISFNVPASPDGTPYYLVLYTQKGGVEMFRETNEEFTVDNELMLGGTPFGTSPPYATGSEYDKADDGNLNTFFDYSQSSGGYTGIDLGASNAWPLSSIVYSPRIGYESRMVGGVFQGSNDDTNYTTLYTAPSVPSSNTRAALNSPAAYRYLRYMGPANSYCNIAEMAFYISQNHFHQVSGTAFGTSPAYSPGHEYDKASDGNINTFFDYSQSSGGYTGIDLGPGNQTLVDCIRVWPRVGFESRMDGGIFQGSNDNTNYTTICTINETPQAGSTYLASDPVAYRYLRYMGPANSYCDIAEMEFFAPGAANSNSPPLNFNRAGNAINFSWSNSEASLYYTSNLATTWSLVGQTPSISNGQSYVSLPIGSGQAGFFRLVYP